MGHARVYYISDIITRFEKLRGINSKKHLFVRKKCYQSDWVGLFWFAC